MRPLRLLASLATSLVTVSLLLYFVFGWQTEALQSDHGPAKDKTAFGALFSFTSPGSLFPPSAIISLTDDNSTFFLARPAAFGPALPSDSLSGPLWIGTGFGDDATGKGAELGCSDAPAWDGPDETLAAASSTDSTDRGTSERREDTSRTQLDGAWIPKYRIGKSPAHADVESLQQAAEIAGKIVLLKRGGCGFLEKVMWTQRRGGVALIVGDDQRGGALVRMYARGDTSNVSIPALFTSHTTAHLLSSLLPSGDTHSGLSPAHAKRSISALAKQPLQPTGESSDDASLKQDTQTPSTSGTLDWASQGYNDAPVPKSQKEGLDVGDSEEVKRWSVLSSGEKRESLDHQHVKSSGAPFHPARDPDSGNSNHSHKGLWVTLTPTNMSTSPFFDTLLVLVVSPLVTLTVVYALLLLRSRIRRRRWRAPKSLVERLPVRTYHTISDSSPSATPIASSPTTPLLQHEPIQPASSHSLPRPSAESEEPATSSSIHHGRRTPEEEKRESGLAAWRRKYGGRQKECVVCLEEYVDGVSRVMSLPCGHEFHADCM